MNKFKEYFTAPCGVILVEADEETVISITALQGGKMPEEDCEPNTYTKLCVKQLSEYFAGDRRVFSFPYRLTGTDFQNSVWAEIAKIPYGKTISYKELAERIGAAQSVRAVANAAGANKLLFVVPCHRIIGSDGSLTGFSAGLKQKEYLLDLEKEPVVYNKYNYYEMQKKRGIDYNNRITGRFIYDIGDTLFEIEPDTLLGNNKTHVFNVHFDLENCSGFTVECFCESEHQSVDPAYNTGAFTADGLANSGDTASTLTVTLYSASDTYVSKAPLKPGENKLHFDINNMRFSQAYKLSVSTGKPLTAFKISKLNVLDQYFRYKGQKNFFTAQNCEIEEKDQTLHCKMNGVCEIESTVLPDSSNTVYNMLMPRRNTVFVVLKNLSTATEATLYYKTTKHTEYAEANSVTLPISRNPEYKAYYFNVSATPGCEGRLMQFKLCFSGCGEIVLREYSFEEEKRITESAGTVTSCVAADNRITVKGFIDSNYSDDEADGVITVYATTMENDSDSPEGKECVASVSLRHAAADGIHGGEYGRTDFTVENIPFKKGNVTRLSFQFAAFLTLNGRTMPIGERFYIDNYMDFDSNPYEFTLPSYSVTVTDELFGAKGDACTDDTDAIQKAIDYVWKQGGGTVILPGSDGEDKNSPAAFYGKRYRITNLLLRSRIELHFEHGAVLWQSPIYRDYKYVPTYGHDVGIKNVCWTHCLHVANLPTLQCTDSEYVKVTGFGKIRSVDTGSEEGVFMPSYSTGCPDRIHQISFGFYEVKHIELRDFEIVRSNNYHLGLYGCSYLYAANVKMHEVRCVSGDGFGLSKGSHHVALNRNFFQSNDDGVVLSGCYFDPRGMVWWKSRLGIHGGTRHVRIAHSYINSTGGKALAFITWGTSDPNYEMQEVSDITAYDNYLTCVNPVGAWHDNPYNGRIPFDNAEMDDYSPVKSVRIFNNIYEGDCNIGPIKATDFISDCGIYSADNFQNSDFCISMQPNLSNWSYKRNKNRDSVAVHTINGKICGVMRYFSEGDTSLYQGLHLLSGAHKCTFDLLTGETGVYLFAQNIKTGEILAEKHVVSAGKFGSHEIKFQLAEDSDVYVGLRHPADMTSDDDFTALLKANMESVEN